MMKKIVLIFLLTLFVACDKKFNAPQPDVLIEQKIIENILFDIKFLSASKSKKFKILKDNNVVADQFIFEKYKIDSITLYQNIAYYSTNSFEVAKEIEKNIELRFNNELKKVDSTIKIKDNQRLDLKQIELIQR